MTSSDARSPGSPATRLPDRIRAVGRLLTTPSAPVAHAHAECEVATHLARELQLGTPVVEALDFRGERYDGKGPRRRGSGSGIPLVLRIVDVADVAELFIGEGSLAAGVRAIERRRGGQLDPAIVDLFADRAAELAALIDGTSTFERFLAAEGEAPRMVDGDDLVRVARTFSRVIDLKSYYTPGHSQHVADTVARAAEAEGLSPDDARSAVVAAYLHDLGNLAIPTGLLDKPGPLSRWELEQVKSHAHQTVLWLHASRALETIAALCGGAHEYGTGGYPRGAGHASLPAGARLLMAADVYCALREPRAHRPAHDARSAEKVLRDQAREGRICARAAARILEVAGHAPRKKSDYPRGLSEREVEVLRLVAIGRTNPEIGRLLAISPRTAQRHVMNIYDKVGVASRAALALFAIEHRLLSPS